MTPRVGARDSRPACSVTFPRGVGCAGPVAVRERSRDRSVRSPLRVSIADVCVCGARAPEVLSARSELSLSSAPSSGVECPPCGAEESRLSEEDVDEDSE